MFSFYTLYTFQLHVPSDFLTRLQYHHLYTFLLQFLCHFCYITLKPSLHTTSLSGILVGVFGSYHDCESRKEIGGLSSGNEIWKGDSRTAGKQGNECECARVTSSFFLGIIIASSFIRRQPTIPDRDLIPSQPTTFII